ncbi:CHRD domain-containing protein [Natronococcus wangiae]|uniref:CHRD domain-containing protein n=1 Tax=Natronococcus wangiae TaxID=3068275 RepID=UPI00273D451A|nr:CHRD domain-containing protein [Natronococcus sp. AD5]
MANDNNHYSSVSRKIHDGISRRRVLSTVAVVAVASGTASLASGQEDNEIELAGSTGGWEGVAPAEIEGEENPTLTLEPGEEYTVTWANEDGQPHNFVIETEDDEHLVETEIISEGNQTVEFTATEDMAEYYCEVHPDSMQGDIQLADDTTEEPAEDENEDEPAEAEAEDEESSIEFPREYHAHLLGDPHGVETEASGEARFSVNEDGTEADYEVTVENICNVTQAHIHLGTEGEDGPVVVWLYPEEGMEPELLEGQFSGTLAEGTITADDFVGEWEDTDFADAVATFEEEGAYVNVHTEEHPDGEIRGQTLPPHE